jgi:hypothetical protein
VNPDDLLAQIRDLLQQYVGMGPDTPVAQQAGDLLSAIEATDAGGGDQGAAGAQAPPPDMGGMPPDAGGMPPDMAGGMPPDAGAMPPDMPPPDDSGPPRRGGSPGNEGFDKARSGAKEFLKKKSKAA